MDFDFSAEHQQLGETVRRLLVDRNSIGATRSVLEGKQRFDEATWASFAEMGLIGCAIPERFGGLGMSYLDQCVIAEETGRELAAIPLSSSVYLAAELLLAAGTEEQKARFLPAICAGTMVGCFALSERAGEAGVAMVHAAVVDGRLSGIKLPVADGEIAHFAIVAAGAGSGEDLSLYIVDLAEPGVCRRAVKIIDNSRPHAALEFNGVPADLLGTAGNGRDIIRDVFDRCAVLLSFEQLGGAERSLEMARDYALAKKAFGRQIGSFQSLKHLLADMFVATALARANCYYGAWALSTEAAELPLAAATAHLSATKAFQFCSSSNIHIHGGMGFTWEFDCHLYYRRSAALSLLLGSQRSWERLLIERLGKARKPSLSTGVAA